MKKVEKYDMIEFEVPSCEGALLIENCGAFFIGETKKYVSAFADGNGQYKLRFMPDQTGIWEYKICIAQQSVCGKFEVIQSGANNHGPVMTCGDHFVYADQTPYIPFGTTCYAWIHQPGWLQQQTLKSLSGSPFNKIRMCVFPKSMPYNHNDPDCYPFLRKKDGTWDVTKPDPVFWNKIDQRISDLCQLGIEADLILFHPYDRWGFSRMSQEESLIYLEYCIVRLGAYRNLWWSLANEYDDMEHKSQEDWDAYGEMIAQKDIYRHLVSVHNIITPYPKRSWMTHCSIQSGEIDKVISWKKAYQIPVIIDECGYEGNLPYGWGCLTGFEMVHRFWWTVCRGGFCTHGETFHREDEILWWAKGGQLYGESPQRIEFLKKILYNLSGNWQARSYDQDTPYKEAQFKQQRQRFARLLKNASREQGEKFIADVSPKRLYGENFILEYFGRLRPAYTDLFLEEGKRYKAEIIDIWEMTRIVAVEGICGRVRLGLPGKEGIALLLTQMSEDADV